MVKSRKIGTLIFVCVASLLFPLLAHAQCHPSPDLSIMDRDFLNYLKSALPGTSHKVAILPFKQNPGGHPDKVFATGIPFFIYDTFAPTNAEILHPYLSFDSAKKLGLQNETLADASSAQRLAEDLNVPYIVFGSYQVTSKNKVRVVINLYNNKSKKALSPARDFETPLNDALFVELTKAITEGFKADRSAPTMKASPTQQPSLQVFREYSQGLDSAQHYNINDLTLALAWLKKSHSDSLKKYDAAGIELARVYFMLGLLNKLSNKNFSPDWINAQATIRELTSPLKEDLLKQRILKRFIDFETWSIKATTAFLKNEKKDSNYSAQQALRLVPEDGMMQNLYLKTLTGQAAKGVSTENAVCF